MTNISTFSAGTLLNTLKLVSGLAKRRFEQVLFARNQFARIRVVCRSEVLSAEQKVKAILAIAELKMPEKKNE